MRPSPQSLCTPAPERWVGAGCAGDAAVAARAALAGAAAPALLVAFAAGADGLAAAAAGLAGAAPGVPVIGCATPITLPGLPARPHDVAVAALGGPGLSVSTAVVGAAGGLREAGAEAAACLGDVADRAFQVLLLFVDVSAGDPQDVVRGAYSVTGAGVPLVGGGALGDTAGAPAFLHGGEAHAGAVVAAAIGSDAPLGVGVRHGLRADGDPFLVTRTDGARVLELDGRPALDAYLERLVCDEDDDQKLLALARAYPLGVSRRAGEEQVRTVIDVDFSDRSLTLLGQLPEGGLAWPMAGDPSCAHRAAAGACDDAVAALGGAAPRGLLAFEPLAHHHRATESLPSLSARGVPVATGTVMGQIARPRGLVGFHNMAHAVLAVA